MAEYLIQKETLDNIAVEVMELAGKTAALSPAEIISDLVAVNSEVSEQALLLGTITSTLDAKLDGSGGTSSAATCTVFFPANGMLYTVWYTDADGALQSTVAGDGGDETITVLKGSIIVANEGRDVFSSDFTAVDSNTCTVLSDYNNAACIHDDTTFAVTDNAPT